jgi:hypothetical protein
LGELLWFHWQLKRNAAWVAWVHAEAALQFHTLERVLRGQQA